jgi:uncharacterized damage-inducible protein DinB
MDDDRKLIEAIYSGWSNYQGLLITALAPLNLIQLAYQSTSTLRTIEEIATHIVGARGRWFAPPLGDGSPKLAEFSRWDRRGEPVRSAEEIVAGLQFTLDYIHSTIARWTPDEWALTIPGEGTHEPSVITRQWVVWHLIEHDLHHGGEISLTMGMYRLKAPDL